MSYRATFTIELGADSEGAAIDGLLEYLAECVRNEDVTGFNIEEEAPDAEKRRRAIVALAKEEHEREGELEIDENAPISDGMDNGCYVQAWVWFSFSGTEFDKEKEEEDEEE